MNELLLRIWKVVLAISKHSASHIGVLDYIWHSAI